MELSTIITYCLVRPLMDWIFARKSISYEALTDRSVRVLGVESRPRAVRAAFLLSISRPFRVQSYTRPDTLV